MELLFDYNVKEFQMGFIDVMYSITEFKRKAFALTI